MAANIQLAPMINSVQQDGRILFRFKRASPISPLALLVCQPCGQCGRLLRRQGSACHRLKRWLATVLARKGVRKRSTWCFRSLAAVCNSLRRFGSLASVRNAFWCPARGQAEHQPQECYNSHHLVQCPHQRPRADDAGYATRTFSRGSLHGACFRRLQLSSFDARRRMILLARISLISRCRGTGSELPVRGLW